MARPPSRLEPWKQLNVRIEPSLYRALMSALANPLYLRLPPSVLSDFVSAAIRHELELRGLPCAIPFSDSSTPTGPTEVEFF